MCLVPGDCYSNLLLDSFLTADLSNGQTPFHRFKLVPLLAELVQS